MSMFSRVNELSVVMKVALGAGVTLLVFLFVIEPLLDARADLAARADQARQTLAGAVDDANERTRLAAQIARGEERYGPVALPALFEERSAELDESIRTILDDNAIERESIMTRFNAMPRGTLQEVLANGQSVEQVVKTIRFDATPEQLVDVVAALEESPYVVGISHIDIRRARDGERRVLVDLTVDGWVIARQGASR